MNAAQYVPRLTFSLGIGAMGGACFYSLSLPLPWMLGAMCAVVIAALSRLPIVSARRIRPPLAAVIGVTLGSSFHPSMITRIADWLPITGAMVITTILVGAVGYNYLVYVAKFDRVTAYFAGMPAGVYEMTTQGGLAGGDERRIALIQAVRIFLVVLLVPFVFNLFLHFGSTSGLSLRPGAPGYSLRDIALLIGCGGVGWGIAALLKVPNAPLLGPMIVSATVHLLGMTGSVPPYVFISAAQIVLGTSIGGQFIGANRRLFASSVGHGLVLLPLMIGVCLLVALITSEFTNIGFPATFLALAPGGTAEMSLVALAIHAEVAVVVLHQLLRVVLIHTCAPILFRRLSKRSP